MSGSNNRPVWIRKWLLTTAVLFGLWTVLSDKRDAVHLATGLVGALVVVLSLALGRSPQPARDPHPLRFLAYLPWLLLQILKSNIHVARLVLSRTPKIRPRFIRFQPRFADPRALTLLGTSITLTPGTLTVDIDQDEMIVHALDDASAADIEAQVMAVRIAPLFDEVVK
jgi:multicomponent Na+:H+ antiporter subunit E